MAEKLTSSTGSVNTFPKKRKVSEKEDISFLTFDIDKALCLSEDESLPFFESDISTWSGSGNHLLLILVQLWKEMHYDMGGGKGLYSFRKRQSI